MRIRHGFIIIVACIAIQIRSHPSLGAQVLDQSYLPTTYDELFNLGVSPYTAQTVTAGITGYLTEADLDIIRQEDIQTQPWEVTVRTVDSQGAAASTLLATQILPGTAAPLSAIPLTPQMVVQFSNPAFITAGEKFALVIDSIGFVYQSGGFFAGLGAASGGYSGDTPYPHGSAYIGDASGSFSNSNGSSLIFATYVTVPEPSSFLAIAGIAWLGLRRRRRISAK